MHENKNICDRLEQCGIDQDLAHVPYTILFNDFNESTKSLLKVGIL